MKQGLVSVVIPTFNRADLIVECVDSALSQTYANIEVMVVDDGSTDDTLARLKELQNRHGSRISVVSQEHAGVSAARSRGLKASRGEFVQFLDSDDLLYPDKIERQVADLTQNPAACLSYCVTRETNAVTGEVIPSTRATGETLTHLYPRLLGTRLWGTLTPLYRITAIERAGAHFLPLQIFEDWEFESRIAALAMPVVHNKHCLAEIRKGLGKHPSPGAITGENVDDLCTVMESVYQRCPVDLRVGSDLDSFARSAFFYARRAFMFRKDDTAVRLLELAGKASPNMATTLKIRMFNLLRLVLDPAALARFADRIRAA
jgi:glycosyltransferase involved in cell wall biosynthesis